VLDIDTTAQEVRQNAINHGFEKEWDEYAKLCLIHSEVTEAMEEIRHGHDYTELYFTKDKEGRDKPEGYGIEMADIVIRVMHSCAKHNISLAEMIRIKMAYNEGRPYMHNLKA
jgi:NTP pyrophosphatase (non-canonical NTP hydrolase)